MCGVEEKDAKGGKGGKGRSKNQTEGERRCFLDTEADPVPSEGVKGPSWKKYQREGQKRRGRGERRSPGKTARDVTYNVKKKKKKPKRWSAAYYSAPSSK